MKRLRISRMDSLQEHPLLILTLLAVGLGIFIRLVAKEKHRRDKHLLARLQAKIESAAEENAA